jgi:hypothetical protein
MGIRQTLSHATVSAIVTAAMSMPAHAGVLGGPIGGGLTGFGGFGGTLNSATLNSASYGSGALSAGGQLSRPNMNTQPAKSAAKNSAADATPNPSAKADGLASVAGSARTLSAETGGAAQGAANAAAPSSNGMSNAVAATSNASPSPPAVPASAPSTALGLNGGGNGNVEAGQHSAAVWSGASAEHSTGTTSTSAGNAVAAQ